MATIPVEKCPPVFSKRGVANRGLPKLDYATWYVVQVKSRRDKLFAHHLHSQSISYFLPMQRKQFVNGGSLLWGMELILPGFVFVLTHGDGYHRMLDTHHVFHVLKTNDQIGLKRDLRDLARAVTALNFNRLESFVPGKKVRVRDGHALAGMEARVDLRNGNHIVLDVAMIGSAVFEIKADFLEIIR